MDSKEKVLQKAKKVFKKLKTDPKSVLLSEEKIEKLVKKLKKLTNDKDNLLLKLINISEQNISDENIPPTRDDYVEKRQIDRSALYSFDGAFQLIHAIVINLEFLGKNPTTPTFVLLVVYLYPSKVYAYPLRSGKQILQRLGQFYYEINHKRNKKKDAFKNGQ